MNVGVLLSPCLILCLLRVIKETSVNIDVRFVDGTRFARDWVLPWRISPDESTWVLLSTKLDFVLRKKDGENWDLAFLK